MRDFPEYLGTIATDLEARLDALLPTGNAIAEAMRWGTLGGGKRLRGFLVVESAALFDVSRDLALNTAAAIECLHAYSLIHDDLPCMDDDDLRRGRPTVHRRWDEATAVLAGDALQTQAFAILSDPATHPDPSVRIALVSALAAASGQGGMVGGQAMDIAAETAGRMLDLFEIRTLQALKTGALIRFAAQSGALLGQGDSTARDALTSYADALGAAFQIRDDLLDVDGDEAAAGKALNKDAQAGKATYVSLLGVDGARQKADELIAQAIFALKPFGTRADALADAARYTISRTT
ncbi:polyprenyl synthetase family protein [Pontivivens nitratireducens]|uniref:Geranylgeranyl diphosphate synthase n=1 Tax=Pontivivens nitratireducens TaxID=2758038 RepID=A0A6G7VJH6_9RHOB|nr:farnesyl diphosphate synthase [Pontibrevibacter nitratireducens]QIK40189.1 polyprenyl synthetase family protein [Pontibrevibacter nitratireducens]